MVRRALLTIVLAAGCKFRPGVAARGDGGSGGSNADAADARGIDTPPDAQRDCLASWEPGPPALSAPQLIAELSAGAYDRDPFVTPDELTIYWSSKRGGDPSPHLYRATRAHWSLPFSNITMEGDLDSSSTDGKMSMTADGLDVVFASNRAGHVGTASNFDLWEATRASAQDGFSAATETELLPNVDSMFDQLDPALSWDGLTLFWADSVSGHQQVIVASRPNRTSQFANTSIAADDIMGVADPAVSRDLRVLLFTQNTPTNEADIFYKTRASAVGAFGSPTALSINTGFEEGDAFLSYDGCDLFFASTQQSSGVYQVYVSHVD